MKVEELFDVKYGVNLELVTLEIVDDTDKDGINFVARTSSNNGVVARLKRIDGLEPQSAGILSCAGGGSVLSTFVQNEPFYSGRDLYTLTPKKEMTLQEKLYYCMCIKANAYKYNYGRQANRTLKSIELPDVIPEWVYNTTIIPITTSQIGTKSSSLKTEKWGEYALGDLFTFHKGKRLTKDDMTEGTVNFIGAISENNGVRQFIDAEPMFSSNCITVNYNGSVGEAFYQSEPFWASDDVNVLYANGWELNKHVAMFVITVIKSNRSKFSYGRKWTLEKMKESIVKLPKTKKGAPDWSCMEDYIKSLPYSDRI
ncbi:MAG: restriction endonuclease subunit S [Oscillospiraceae bacterium]|jgi:hypothetical protein|nr:restriction endonuclease subunit S [Oscillospiraceae bacterium]